MASEVITPIQKRWSASELRRLPPEHRRKILESAAAMAEAEYLRNPDLTAFEAFGEDDIHGESTGAATR